MSKTCDLVVERVALGEPLGELADHAAGCARCRRLAALPAELGKARSEADPGIGFAARITAGAQHRVAIRRRRRVAVGLAAAVATAAVAVFLVTRAPESGPIAITPVHHDQPATDPKPAHPDDPWSKPPRALDPDVAALVHLADVDKSGHLSARWGHIQRPLSPYRALLKGVTP